MAGVAILKVITESLTASFRYPHVQVGRLPSFEVPPPATVYGHLAGVIGEWFDPEGLEFAYVFEHQGVSTDVETSQPIERGHGRKTLAKRGWNYPVNVVCEPNPQRREFLFRPRLTLYLRGPVALLKCLEAGFLSPCYTYVLGRSQDLATCRSSQLNVQLATSDKAFFSHTILPYSWRPYIGPGQTVRLPKSIDYRRHRAPSFERYLQVLSPAVKIYSGSPDTIGRDQLPEQFDIDPADTRSFAGRLLSRGLAFQVFDIAA